MKSRNGIKLNGKCCRGMGEENMGSGLESRDSRREDRKLSIKQGWEERRWEAEWKKSRSREV